MDILEIITHLIIYSIIILIFVVMNIPIKIIYGSKIFPQRYWGFREFSLFSLYFLFIIVYAQILRNIFDEIVSPYSTDSPFLSMWVIILKLPYMMIYIITYFTLFRVRKAQNINKLEKLIIHSIILCDFIFPAYIWGIIGAFQDIVNKIFL